MSVQTEPKNEHDPHQCQSPRTLPDTVSQYPNTPPSESHPHDHQILHVYTWQAIHNGISISLHYDSCGCICSPAYFTPQAAGNTTLRDLTLSNANVDVTDKRTNSDIPIAIDNRDRLINIPPPKSKPVVSFSFKLSRFYSENNAFNKHHPFHLRHLLRGTLLFDRSVVIPVALES